MFHIPPLAGGNIDMVGTIKGNILGMEKSKGEGS
jgi:hypothetical protein